MSRLFFFVLCFWLSESNAISPEKCINQNRKCDMHGDNMIHSEAGVTGPECQQLCEDTTDCNVFTYFGPESFPYHQFCMLFISCDTLDECEDCVTVNVKSDCSCGISYEGSIDSDNIVEIKEDVQTEQDCRSLCSSKSSCSVYTYYDDAHVTDANLCLLLNALHNPVQICENCQTGSDKCAPFEECRVGVWEGGDVLSVETLLVTESQTITYISGEVGCNKTVNAVAVGSGATGQACNTNGGGGGGSGHINTYEFVLQENTEISVEIDIIAGGGTFLTVKDTEEVLLTAANGATHTGCSYAGGDGYSGGAGGGKGSPVQSGGDGGSDGNDGQASSTYPAGRGSGFKISSIFMSYYKLSVGKGGTHQGMYGGGGGGLLVDGYGPENGNNAGVGEGYGGGGKGASTSPDISGSPGCVILEA